MGCLTNFTLPSLGDVFCSSTNLPLFSSTQQKVCNRIRPVAIVIPNTEADVAYTINYVRTRGHTLSYIGGGHSYTCTSTKPNSVQISMRNFDQVVDNKNGTVTVGGGVTFHSIFKVIDRQKYTIAHGECDSVGMAGFSLHGGVNPKVTRISGLGNASILSMRVVLANGTTTYLDRFSADQELWRAMRIAGSNFGIATQLTLKYLNEPEPMQFSFVASLDVHQYASIIADGFKRTRDDGNDAFITFDRSGPLRAPMFSETFVELNQYNFYFSARRQNSYIPPAVVYAVVYARLLRMLPTASWPTVLSVPSTFDDWGYATFVATDEVISVWNCFEMTCDVERISQRLVEHYRDYSYADATRFCWQNLFAPTAFAGKMCYQYTCPDLPVFVRQLRVLDEELNAMCPEYVRYYNMGVHWDANASKYLTHNYEWLREYKQRTDPSGVLNRLSGTA